MLATKSNRIYQFRYAFYFVSLRTKFKGIWRTWSKDSSSLIQRNPASHDTNILATCYNSVGSKCLNCLSKFNEYKLLLFGHRNLMRNTTQTAVINILRYAFVNLTFRIFVCIHTFGKIFILQNIWNLNRDDTNMSMLSTRLDLTFAAISLKASFRAVFTLVWRVNRICMLSLKISRSFSSNQK